MTDDTGRPTFRVPDEIARQWAAVAHGGRMASYMLDGVVDPEPRTPFAADDSGYRWEKLSAWVRGYLIAAVDHLLLWANTVAPLQVFEGQVNDNPPRPYYSIGRGALEAAAQAGWVMRPVDSRERVQRHLRLLYQDLRHHELALRPVNAVRADFARRRRDDMLNRIDGVYSRGSIKDEPKYLDMVREAGPEIGKTEAEMELVWRSASAGAHGKAWFNDYATTMQVGEEYEPGYYRAAYVPDPTQVLRVMDLAGTVTHAAVHRYLTGVGTDPTAALGRASTKLAAEVPQRDQ